MELNQSILNKSLKPISEKSKCNISQAHYGASLQALSNLQTLLKSKVTIMKKIKHLKLKNKQCINTLHLTDLREKLRTNLNKINNPSTTIHSTINLRKCNSQCIIPTQLSLEIGSLFQINYRNVRDFTNLHGSLSKLREIVKDQGVYSHQKKIEIQAKLSSMDDSVVSLQSTYKEIESHILSLEQYNNYLKKRFLIEKQVLEEHDNQKNELKSDIRNIMLKIEKLKAIREVLLSYRNFFVCVKEHRLSLPSEFNQPFQYRLNKRKKHTVMNKKTPTNQKIPNSKKLSNDDSQNTNDKKAFEILLHENAVELYLNPKVPIFSSTETFIEQLIYYDNQNLKLAYEYNNSITELEKFKKELVLLELDHKNLKEDNGIMKKKMKKILVDLKKDNRSLQLTQKNLGKEIENRRNKRDIDRYMNQNRSLMQKGNLSLFRYYHYCHKLRFSEDFAYVYYYAGMLMKKLYKKKASLFKEHLDAQFKEDKFKQIIVHLTAPDMYSQGIIRDECLYCFRILESVINSVIISNRKYRSSSIIQERLKVIEEQRKNARTLLNSKEHRYLQGKKRKERVQEIWLKSNKILYRSHSGLFFDSKNSNKTNKEFIHTSTSAIYENALFNISEQSSI